MKSKTCLIIAGPTAVGKTAAAIQIAQHFKTAIVSADSRQCYHELNIGVAKPSVAELQSVQHYFINSHSIHDEVNAAVFETYALDAVNTIFEKNDLAVMVGGTGLYIKAFCEGMDDMPAVDPTLREKITTQYNEQGLPWLQQQVQQHDPLYYTSGEIQNPRRLMRALEMVLTTGKSILSYQNTIKVERPFNIIKVGLDLPREELYRNINHRVDVMIKDGLVEEARALIPHRHLNALQTVGYTELFDYFDGTITLERAIELIKQNTRHYAKRQLTWFRRDEGIIWFKPDEVENIIQSGIG